jgi:hypothetical protein
MKRRRFASLATAAVVAAGAVAAAGLTATPASAGGCPSGYFCAYSEVGYAGSGYVFIPTCAGTFVPFTGNSAINRTQSAGDLQYGGGNQGSVAAGQAVSSTGHFDNVRRHCV